ncbi:MAG TPA: hypothetical protein VGD17_03700 [Chitinophagaceae bacterium]
MSHKHTIRIKAVFLLAVFSLNSLLGFACSVGIDLGYNKHHHEISSSVTSAPEEMPVDHCGMMDEAAGGDENSSASEPEDCCKEGVLQLTLSDKKISVSPAIEAPLQLSSDISAIYFIYSWKNQSVSTEHYFVRSDHPPIAVDIRVSIQSFQI